MTLAGRLSGNAIFATATALFVVGAALGLVHGAVLGFFGRPAAVTPREAGRDLGRAGLYAVPALAVAWLAAHLRDSDLVLLHVGDRAEYDAEHLPGAQFVSLNDFAAPMSQR